MALRSPNHLLASLSGSDFELLGPHLRSVELVHEAVLAEAGDPLARAYFPHSGVISLVVSLAEGEMVEVAMVGRDSVFGASAALDGGVSLHDAIVQLPGAASIVDIARLRTAVGHGASTAPPPPARVSATPRQPIQQSLTKATNWRPRD